MKTKVTKVYYVSPDTMATCRLDVHDSWIESDHLSMNVSRRKIQELGDFGSVGIGDHEKIFKTREDAYAQWMEWQNKELPIDEIPF